MFNVFKEGDGAEVYYKGEKAGCGNILQLNAGQYYATYMHLSSYANGLAVNDVLSENEVIAHVGNSGTSSEANGLPNGYHLHFSLATSDLLYVYNTTTANANVLNWDDEQINDFLDPLAYFN